jgi:hypothetical protein
LADHAGRLEWIVGFRNHARNLAAIECSQFSFDIFEATLDSNDMGDKLLLLEGWNLAFSIVAKSSKKELPVAQEPLSLFLCHAPA